MRTNDYTVKVIQAEAGKYLTEVREVNILDRTLTADKIYLAVTDSADNWREIDESEYQAYLAQREAAEKESEVAHDD